MQPELLSQLKIEIHNKCVAYDYNDATDNTLSDFIINLIQVNKTAQEVNEELLSLVGSDYDSNLTQWIFERKKELENSLTGPVEQSQQSQQPENTEQPSQIERDVIMDDKSKVVKTDRENRMFSKAIGSVIGHVKRNERPSQYRRNERSRTRSRSPTRPSVRDEKDRYSSRHEHRRSSKQEERNGSNNILSRLGNSNKSSGSEVERPSVFDRLGNAKPIPSVQNDHDSKKERCKYWPSCKNGEECIYFHPTTVCPDFPNCSKPAIECMFIHPEVTKPVMQQIKKLPVPCKFFPYCSNPHCPFVHPVPQQSFFMQTNPSPFALTGHRVQIPCKNADACTRPDCHFLHPKDHNPQSEVICKFDGACTRPNCFYKHTKTNDPSKSFKKPDMNSRQFSVAEEEVVERIPVGNSADLIVNQTESSHINTDEDVVMDTN